MLRHFTIALGTLLPYGILIVNVYQRIEKTKFNYVKEIGNIQMNPLKLFFFSMLKYVSEFDSKKVIFEVFL